MVIAGVVVALLIAAGLLALLVHDSGGGHPRAGSSAPTRTPSGGSSSTLATPAPSVSVPSFPTVKPTAAERVLLDKRVGFGGKVTGGAGGTLVHVSTDADSGAGSLREALQGNAPRWIVFDKDLTVRLSTALAVGSNKTIDGRGHKVEITGHGLDGLDIVNSSNVIVESLTLHDFGDTAQTKNNDLNDAIHLDRAKGVWIDHNDLSMAGDKLLAVSNGSLGITVTWNHFHDQLQTFQIGNQATAQADTQQTVTVAFNFFDRTGYRNPVVSYGRAHVYDNYYLDWKLYAVRSERAAQLYLQNNVFDAGSNPRAVLIRTGGDGCNDKQTRCDSRVGNLKVSGNLLLGGAKIKKQYVSGTVFSPATYYRYASRPATSALASSVAKDAGPQ